MMNALSLLKLSWLKVGLRAGLLILMLPLPGWATPLVTESVERSPTFTPTAATTLLDEVEEATLHTVATTSPMDVTVIEVATAPEEASVSVHAFMSADESEDTLQNWSTTAADLGTFTQSNHWHMQVSQSLESNAIAQTFTDEDDFDRWYVQAEFILLDRSVSEIDNTVDFEAEGEDIQLEIENDIDFDFQPGTRLTVGHQFAPRDAVEFTFWGLYNFNFDSDVNVDIPEQFADVLNLNGDLDYDSQLNSFELNYRRSLSPQGDRFQADLLAGLRYVRVDENFELDLISTGSALIPDGTAAELDINVDNNIFGLQIGGDLSYQVADPLNLGLVLKSGLFFNSASQDSDFTNRVGVGPASADGDASETEITPLVEAGLFLTWNINQDISLRAGYNLLFLGSLIFAPEQFVSELEDEEFDDLFRSYNLYHGPSIGLLVEF